MAPPREGSVEPDSGDGGGPRRSALLQERSRRTRHQLVRTALAIWNERGFERGVEETTVEEIALQAGVSKGTFYFHFAHKEDILLEIGWAAAEAMLEEAETAMRRGRPSDRIINSLLSSLARRVERGSRMAVIRAIAEFHRRAHDRPVRPGGAFGFEKAFIAVASYAIERGELPPEVDPQELGAILQAVTMDTLQRWAHGGKGSPRAALQRHADLIWAGAIAVNREPTAASS